MTTATRPARTAPPPWLNAFMRAFLRTPGLQRVIGKSVLLLTFTGRRSGRRYTTPVTYVRQDGTVIVLSRRSRTWWRNFETHPDVELRLAGCTHVGRAEAHPGSESDLATVSAFLKQRRVDARGYGVRLGDDGSPFEQDVRALLPTLVVVRVELAAST